MSEINYDNDDENGGWGMGMNAKNNNLKLRYLFAPQRQDSDQESHECPDLDFIYDDADTLANEIAEIYSYSEQPEFRLNVKAFEDHMETMNLRPSWGNISEKQKRSIISTLQDNLDVSDRTLRTSTARCFLYLLQGCWAECQSDVEQQTYAKENVLLLYNCGVFTSFLELFLFEIDVSSVAVQRKVAVNISDSIDLRIILTVVYIFVEVIRNIGENDSVEFQKLKREFHEEVSDPIGDELLTIKLFGMVTRYCSGTSPHYPIKKVLLVIWKLILFTLGGTEKLKQMKLEARAQAGLEKFEENTVDIVKTMRACTPPIGGFYDKGDERPAGNRFDMKRRRNLVKQSSLDDESDAIYCPSMEEDIGMDYPMQPEAPSVAAPPAKGLPWAPKIRQKDLDAFLENVRLKFVGFTIPNDRETLIGLPSPICEGVSVLKRYVYRSLADIQIEKEENILKYPLTQSEGEIPLNSTEILYRAMLPGMQQTIIALLKILLAAAPTSKTKTDSINIMADVLPEEMPITVLQSKKLGTDVSRHKEIIVKAISGILLLLLKHCKLNHVYQFEFLSQFLVFANCIPLVLKFFNQNIISYVAAKNIIPILEFPACVIDDPPDPTAENLLIGESQQCCWRNVFSCINLLRILNKVTKWKHSRIMMIVVFKSAPILRRTLKVRHAMMQLYVLKLLKMQTKYLGRQWRKSNMKTMSAIYTKVRHRLNDDWAFGNDLDARPWDFQAEECSLRSSVDKFNSRRYHADYCFDWDYYPMNYNVIEELAHEVDLTNEFKQHYEIWLNQEVFAKTIDWDEVLSATGLPKTLEHA